ncbi:MAG: UbiX family flavin prenyltransferase [Pantoea sp.]|uniref:Flavin prenyltransferase UbiX n=1 Tax=Pantoea phytobeneficialis TaxID=2052056 RepID=A0AAP9H5V4_9GAMM|nr:MULTISPECIES: UbiX family flavin prenyltransferase [Pantoea]ERK05637.1 3-polyprenyl-4-hydroxybenzoate carboxy-lyase UbiX [Pantoea sp. AS-PWVM4]MDO6409483.1 UbiX family flavin prenyltransferase [Pantoea phytobeneficialis]QGR07131.1 aromatic acid decarboxylase [Pantoea phytobeneficialis]
MSRRRIIVGISGASGFQYGMKALQLLRDQDIEVHLVVTKGAEVTRSMETTWQRQEITDLADEVHSISNLGASISSGSFKTLGMLIAPCSMNSLASIAHGLTGNLLTRAADVILKERRRLVLMVRETPLNLVHIRNMAAVTEMGGIVYPPVPAFYQKPQSVDEMVHHSVSRALDLFDLDVGNLKRWGEKHNEA